MNELLQYLFTFDGRVNRARLWIALLCSFLISGAFDLLTPLGTRIFGEALVSLLATMLSIALFVWFLSLQARRLHDRNRTAWWLLLTAVPPTVLFIFLLLAPSYLEAGEHERLIDGLLWASVPIWVIWFWAFIELFCLRGTIGPNRFGPDPLANNNSGAQFNFARD